MNTCLSNPSGPEARRREDALALFQAALRAVDPVPLVRRELPTLLVEVPRAARLLVLAAGKAALGMLQGLAEGLEEARASGWEGQVAGAAALPSATAGIPQLAGVELHVGAHPFPDEGSVEVGRAMLRLVSAARPEDLTLILLSGGASSLMAVPPGDISLEDLRRTTQVLQGEGVPIGETNQFRKHLSLVAGGLLGAACRSRRVVVLAVSDVVGDDFAVIGSGPAYGDESSFADCLRVVEKFGLEKILPPAVLARLHKGVRGLLVETPLPSDPRLSRIEHLLLATNLDACRAMEKAARARGYEALILSHLFEGEARELGRFHAAVGRACATAAVPLKTPAAFISGGEATVRLRGRGRGGRNQETALAAALGLAGLPVTFLSAGTDGIDGNSDAAGGLVDGGTAAAASAYRVDIRQALEENDSAGALGRLDGQIVTGPTGTNVADVRALLVGEAGGATRGAARRPQGVTP